MKAVVFDLDGTLAYTILDIQGALNQALVAMGYSPRTEKETMEVVGNGLRRALEASIEKQGGTYGQSDIDYGMDVLNRYYQDHCCDNTFLYPGMKALVEKLHSQGYALGVLSNKKDSLAKVIIATLFPSGPFCFVSGQGSRYPNKPSCEGLRDFCKTFNVKLQDFVYIGDSEVDYQTARNFDSLPILVGWGYRDVSFLKTFCSEIASDAKDLYNRISRRFE